LSEIITSDTKFHNHLCHIEEGEWSVLRHDILNILANNSIKRSSATFTKTLIARILPLKRFAFFYKLIVILTISFSGLACTDHGSATDSDQKQNMELVPDLVNESKEQQLLRRDLGIEVAKNNTNTLLKKIIKDTKSSPAIAIDSSKSSKASQKESSDDSQELNQNNVATKGSNSSSKHSMKKSMAGDSTKATGDSAKMTGDSVKKVVAKLKKNDKKKSKKKSKKKKNQKCKRGIHKGRKKCKIEKGYISVYHINKKKRYRKLRIIDDKNRIIPETRKILLELLGDWRAKKHCKVGYTFNYGYKGRASWRMYNCYVQDRLLWYLYLIGHHFDSEVHILSGLRANERKTSRHHNGHAVDFTVLGVKAKKVWEYCKRALPLVGIGYYPKGNFIHLDVGRDHHQAYWVDSSGSGESAKYKSGVSQVQRGRVKKSQSSMIASIKRSLKRHYDRFKKKKVAYDKRKKRREKIRKRKARKKKSRKKKFTKKKFTKKKSTKKKSTKKKSTKKKSTKKKSTKKKSTKKKSTKKKSTKK
jgi:hypothetical protein